MNLTRLFNWIYLFIRRSDQSAGIGGLLQENNDAILQEDGDRILL